MVTAAWSLTELSQRTFHWATLKYRRERPASRSDGLLFRKAEMTRSPIMVKAQSFGVSSHDAEAAAYDDMVIDMGDVGLRLAYVAVMGVVEKGPAGSCHFHDRLPLSRLSLARSRCAYAFDHRGMP